MFLLSFINLFLLQFLFVSRADNIPITEIYVDASPSSKQSVQCNDYTYFKVYMPYACKDINITAYPTSGSPVIYVSSTADKVTYPSTDSLSWSGDSTQGYTVSISHWSPDSSIGYYYIGVHNDCSRQDQVATFTLAATTYEDNTDDILVHPELARNQIVPALGYVFYKFCVDRCANVQLTLADPVYNYITIDSNNNVVTKQNFSYSEMLTSRTEIYPTLNSYS